MTDTQKNNRNETVTICNGLRLRGETSHNLGQLKSQVYGIFVHLKLILAKNELVTICNQLNLHAENGNFKWGTNCPLLETFVTQPLKGVKSIAWGNALRVKANNNTSPVRATSLKIKN